MTKTSDKVRWNSSGGESVGNVVKKQTSPTKIKGHKVAASKEDPQYIVKSHTSGKEAAHKADALKKVCASQRKEPPRRASFAS
jgi:hypothetical protein